MCRSPPPPPPPPAHQLFWPGPHTFKIVPPPLLIIWMNWDPMHVAPFHYCAICFSGYSIPQQSSSIYHFNLWCAVTLSHSLFWYYFNLSESTVWSGIIVWGHWWKWTSSVSTEAFYMFKTCQCRHITIRKWNAKHKLPVGYKSPKLSNIEKIYKEISFALISIVSK